MATTGIKAMILDFLVLRQGVPTSIDLLSEELDITRIQASQALSSFVNDGNAGIVRVSNGIYAYTGPSVTTYTGPRAIEHAENSLDQAEREVSARRAELEDAERQRDNAKRMITEQRQQMEILQLALFGIETQQR
jgi:hypothetical protein